jgi:uncharacterized protein (TIGR02569 family)
MTLQAIATPPSGATLAAFGLAGTPLPLAGGQGTAFRVGDAVLKPMGLPAEAEWLAETLAALEVADVRLPRPLRTVDGCWSADGWVAHAWLPGEHRAGRWAEVIAAGERFHAAVGHLDRPGFLDRRADPWSLADRVAWGEAEGPVPPVMAPLLSRLRAARRPVSGLSSQLVHGDLGGNVLFADGLRPAVIDLSLYWRPTGYAEAIVAVDAVAWEGAEPTVLALVRPAEQAAQLLVRAALFRLVTTAIACGGQSARLAADVAAHAPVVEAILAQVDGTPG